MKGDARNTGRQASRSREAQTAAEGALFVQDSPVAPKEAPFAPDTTGMYPRPDSNANWPSTGAPQPRPEERRAQAQLQEAEEYFKDAEEVLQPTWPIRPCSRGNAPIQIAAVNGGRYHRASSSITWPLTSQLVGWSKSQAVKNGQGHRETPMFNASSKPN